MYVASSLENRACMMVNGSHLPREVQIVKRVHEIDHLVDGVYDPASHLPGDEAGGAAYHQQHGGHDQAGEDNNPRNLRACLGEGLYGTYDRDGGGKNGGGRGRSINLDS